MILSFKSWAADVTRAPRASSQAVTNPWRTPSPGVLRKEIQRDLPINESRGVELPERPLERADHELLGDGRWLGRGQLTR